MSATALSLPRRFASLVKLEHTVFALPFAYVGAFLAVDGFPRPRPVLWITLAMIGARTLAMALNRLVDARSTPATRARQSARSPPARSRGRRCGRSVRRRARALPRRGVPARADRSLALADPRRHVRRLPVPEAGHLALPPLARGLHRAGAARRLARGDRAAHRGRRGRCSPPRASGWRASTSSTRSSTSRTTAPQAFARGRRASASAGCSWVRGCFIWRPWRCSRPSGPGSRPASSTGSASAPSQGSALRALARAARRPPPADAAFFTVNGVISVVFFVFVALDTLTDRYRGASATTGEARPSDRGGGLEKRYGRKRACAGSRSTVPRSGFLLVTGPTGRARRRSSGSWPGLAAPTRGRSGRRRQGRSRVCRARAAALPRADGAREPRALRPALPRSASGASGAGCCSSGSVSGRRAATGCRRSRGV